MTDFGEHLRLVQQEQAACASDHADEFAELIAMYHGEEKYLTGQLAADITPERIFMGGTINPVGTLTIPSDEFDPYESSHDPYASVERWAADDAHLVHVNKRADVGNTLMLGFLENRGRFIHGRTEKRMKKIVDHVLASPNMQIRLFEKPSTIEDVVLAKLRETEKYKSAWDNLPDPPDMVRPVEQMNTRLALSGDVPLPEGFLHSQSKGYLELLAFFGMSPEKEAALTESEKEDRLERSRQFLVHEGGLNLLVATTGLQRAAAVVRNGRLVIPTVPQNAVHLWGKEFFSGPLERRLLGA